MAAFEEEGNAVTEEGERGGGVEEEGEKGERMELIYFGIRARGEPCRVAAAMGSVPLQDHRIPFEELMRLKKEDALPLGAIPVLRVPGAPAKDGLYCQSMALLRYIGRLSGLYPDGPGEEYKALLVDEGVDMIEETYQHYAKTVMVEDFELKCRMRAEWIEEHVLPRLEVLEARATAPNTLAREFYTGAEPTTFDAALYALCSTYRSGQLQGVRQDIFDAFPTLSAIVQAVGALPSVQQYEATNSP